MNPINNRMVWCLIVILIARLQARTYSTDCGLDDPDACEPGYCCVKQVISFIGKDPQASKLCRPHLTLGELCLRQSEGYLCDCAEGLACKFKDDETYGHCVEFQV